MTNLYLENARQGKNEFWRYFVTTIGMIAISFLVTLIALLVGVLIEGSLDVMSFSETTLLAASMIPFPFATLVLWLATRFLHRRSFISLINPLGKIHWKRFFASAGIWLVLSALSDVVLAAMQPGNYVWDFDWKRFLPYFLLVLILVPLQTSTEELIFRGYVAQWMGQYTKRLWLPIIIPSIVFGLLHSFNPEVGAYGFWITMPFYVGFGLLLGWVTLKTESLELALGVHMANNLYASSVVTFPNSSLPSPALFRIQEYDPVMGLWVFGIISILYLGVVWMMQKNWMKKAVLLSLFILVGCMPMTPASQTPAVEKLPLADCTLQTAGLPMSVQAKCGRLTVFEDRVSGTGRQIDLHIAVIPAASRTPEADPLFLLAGGPGQAATEAFLPMLSILNGLNMKRDLVMVDQRGTGQSHPLRCESESETAVGVENQDKSAEQEIETLKTCLGNLDADTRFYTTDLAVQDLDEVRAALGYEKINLLGVSYGTRTALAYLRDFPNRVRTMVLDSVVPLGWGLGSSTEADTLNSLELVFGRCKGNDACNNAFPEIDKQFDTLIQTLKENPQEVELQNPLNGQQTTFHLTDLRAATTIRLMLYTNEMTALIPLVIHQANTDKNYQSLAAQAMILSTDFDRSLSDGMYLSVICSEDFPRMIENASDTQTIYQVDLERMKQVCDAWPHAEDVNIEPINQSYDVPVLMISGEADPVTPPDNAQEISPFFPNSLSLVASGSGHNSSVRGCFPFLIRKFIESGSAVGLEISCANSIQPLPFFTSPVNPQP